MKELNVQLNNEISTLEKLNQKYVQVPQKCFNHLEKSR